MMMSEMQVRDGKLSAKVDFPTPSTVASDLEAGHVDVPQLDLDGETKISHYDHAFPVTKLQPQTQRQNHVGATWDQAFLPAARLPVEGPLEKANIAACWETAFGVPRPRNDLMHAILSANSTSTTTWDAAFKAHLPVARFPEMPRAAVPTWDRAFRVC